MTIKELSQLYHLNREIERHTAERAKLAAALEPLTTWESDTVTGSGAAFPFTQHTIKIGGVRVKVGGKAEYYQKRQELQDLTRLIELKQEQCFVEYGRLLRYINEIEDSLTRQVFHLRFVNGLTWNQVAASIGGTNTEDSVRKVCVRYINRNK